MSRRTRSGERNNAFALLVCAALTFACTVFSGPIANADEPAAADAAPQTIPIAEITRDTPVDYHKEIAPLLKRSCLACHNSTKAESNLNLEQPDKILAGGDNGPAIAPGKSAESLLLVRATGGGDGIMPPEGNDAAAVPLTSEELGLLKLWIDQGAPVVGAATETIAWQPLPAGVNPILALAVTPDGQFAACGRANQIFIYHLPTGRVVTRLTDPKLVGACVYDKPGVADLDLVQSLVFSPDGSQLASGGYRNVKFWTRPRNVRQLTIEGSAAIAGKALALAPNAQLLATGGENGEIAIYDLAASQSATPPAPKTVLKGNTAPLLALTFEADGAKLWSAADQSLRCWDVAAGTQVATIEPGEKIASLVLLTDPPRLAAGFETGKIRIWTLPYDAASAPVELADGAASVTSLASVSGAPLRLVAGSADAKARLWNLESRQVERAFEHGQPVTSVATSPDGARLATGGGNLAKLWNAADGQAIAELKGHVGRQLRAAAAERFVEGRKRDVGLMDAAIAAAEKVVTSEQEAQKKAEEAVAAADKALAEKTEAVKQAVAAKDAADKAAADAVAAQKTAEEARTASETAIAEAQKNAELVAVKSEEAQAAADAKPENEFLALAKAEGAKAVEAAQARITEVTAQKAAAEKAIADAPAAIKQTADDAAAKAKAATDAETARVAAETEKTKGTAAVETSKAAVARAQEEVAHTKTESEAVKVRQTEAEKSLEVAKQESAAAETAVRTVRFSPDGLRLVTGGDDGAVHVYSAADGSPFDALEGQKGPLTQIAFVDAGRVVSSATDGSSIVWELDPAWELRATIGSAESADFIDRVTALAFSPDGKLLATGSGDPSRTGEVKLWNVADGSLAMAIAEAHSDVVLGLAFSPDGKHLASCGSDKFVKVFDVASGKLAKSFEGHTHHVLGVSWHGSGRILASCGADNVIKVWDFITGEQRRTIGGYGKEVTTVTFVGETEQMLASSGDQNIRLHEMDERRPVRGFGGAADFVYAAAVTPDGRLVVAGGEDSVLRVWNGADGKEIRTMPPPE